MKAPRNTVLILAALVATLVLASIGVFAEGEPTAPLHFTRGASSTFDWTNFGNVQTDAIAGNITWLTLTGISQTRYWQGFYGNVTGWITLDDANNFTFYNWSAAEPRGYVYASLVSHGDPDWLSVQCFQHADNASAFQTFYNITQDAYDNVTETYNRTDHPDWYIVSNTFSSGSCPTTYIWRDDDYQSQDFVNALFWDTTGGTDGWVFGTMLENKNVSDKTDITCYNGKYCDFQLLVAEDGSGTDTQVTPYFIWVDITG